MEEQQPYDAGTRQRSSKLTVRDRLSAASRMAVRGRIHYDLWWLTAGEEGRQKHFDAIDEYWQHLRFLQHGQLVAAIGEVHCLFDRDKRTINLPILTEEIVKMQPQSGLARVQAELSVLRPTFKKIGVLRNNVFAHRTIKKSYDDVFRDARIEPDQLRELADASISISNELLIAMGMNQVEAPDLPAKHYEAMLRKLNI